MKILALIFIHQALQPILCTPMCDVYLRNDGDEAENYIITIAGYKVPPDRYNAQIARNISCPCPPGSPCLRKCCLQEDSFIRVEKKCRNSDSLSVSEEHRFEPENLPNVPGNFTIIYGSYCPSIERSLKDFALSEDGIAVIGNEVLDINDYCIDYFEDFKQFMMLRCKQRIPYVQSVNKIYTVCLTCSIIFLLITFFVYACTESLRTLPGKILLCYIVSLLITDGFYITLQVLLIYKGTFCIVSAFVVQFSFLASFFWLNIMCFDLWWTFSGYRSFNGSPKERDFKKFLVYCLYAWGCPTIIVAVTAFMQYYPGLSDRIIKPDFGTSKCWFGDDVATFVYFYSFISVILVSNLFMFISTTLTLKNHKKEAKVFKRTGSRRHLDHDKQRSEEVHFEKFCTQAYPGRYLESSDSDTHSDKSNKPLSAFRFNLYLKLFIVMGVNWMMEVISFYVPSLEHLWVVTDIGNSLQGILIFLIFVCKRRVLVLLNKKLCPSHMFIGNTRNRTCSQSTLTSSIASVKPGNICKSSMKVQMETMPNCATKRDFAI